jgi:hypothetical protein
MVAFSNSNVSVEVLWLGHGTFVSPIRFGCLFSSNMTTWCLKSYVRCSESCCWWENETHMGRNYDMDSRRPFKYIRVLVMLVSVYFVVLKCDGCILYDTYVYYIYTWTAADCLVTDWPPIAWNTDRNFFQIRQNCYLTLYDIIWSNNVSTSLICFYLGFLWNSLLTNDR